MKVLSIKTIINLVPSIKNKEKCLNNLEEKDKSKHGANPEKEHSDDQNKQNREDKEEIDEKYENIPL